MPSLDVVVGILRNIVDFVPHYRANPRDAYQRRGEVDRACTDMDSHKIDKKTIRDRVKALGWEDQSTTDAVIDSYFAVHFEVE